MSPYRTILNWITPPEAKPIANELVSEAKKIREMSRKIKDVRRQLDETWTGGAKRKFIARADNLPQSLDRLASSLEAKATAVTAISVWIEIKEWFDDRKGKK